MKSLLFPFLFASLVLPVWAEPEKEEVDDEDCESLVDQMDDIDFADAIDCDEDEPHEVVKSLRSYFEKKSKTKQDLVVTYEQDKLKINTLKAGQPLAKANNNLSISEEGVSGPTNFHKGTSFVIREVFGKGGEFGSIHAAIEKLHAEMADYCPVGWEKEREWTKPAEGGGFYLHYLFTCQ